MEPVLVDLVMATNRASPYLAEALESVLAQTHPYWQLTVVDDGTPDPDAVTKAVSHMPRARVVRQPNRGLPAARNVGIAQGQAPLIALLDDDDIWDPEKLEAQVESLEQATDALASFTAGRYIDGDGREFGSGWPARTVPSALFVNGAEPAPRIVSLMVRRAAHELIGGFNESYSLAEDNEYILRLALHGSMVAVPRPLVSYRRHSTNMSSSGSIDGRRANLRMLTEQLAAHRGDQQQLGLLDESLRRFRRVSADECVRSLVDAVRRRDAHALTGELRWAAASPATTLRALTRLIGRP